MMELDTKKEEEVCIVTVAGRRLDAEVAGDLRQRLQVIIDSGETHLVINLAAVDFIDSSGLGALISVLKYLNRSGDLVLCHIRPEIFTLFKITRMDRVFRIFEEEKEAIAAFQ